MRVNVYKNLHNGLWSIMAAEGEHKGRVLGHASEVYLGRVVPKVSEAGRQRVIAEGRKNVHAYLQGDLLMAKDARAFKGRPLVTTFEWSEGAPFMAAELMEPVGYNPFKGATFYWRDTGEVLDYASDCYLHPRGVVAA